MLALAASAPVAAPPLAVPVNPPAVGISAVPSPRIILQFGHNGPVEAAAFTQRGLDVITAASSDALVIIWQTGTGAVIDRLRLPLLGHDGRMVPQRIAGITMSPDDRTAHIDIIAGGAIDTGHYGFGRFAIDLDMIGRSFTQKGPMQALGAAEAARLLDIPVPQFLAATSSGSQTLRSDGSAPRLQAADGKIRRLTGKTRGYFISAELSPDATRLARLIRKGVSPATTTSIVWDSGSNTSSQPFTLPGDRLSRIRWLNNQLYLLSDDGRGNDAVLAPVVDADRGRQVGAVPAKCLMQPVGSDGLFVAAGPGSCGAAPSAADGLWFYDRDDPAGTGFTLARHWRRVPQSAVPGQIVTSFTWGLRPGTSDIYDIYAATRPLKPVGNVYPVNWLHISTVASEKRQTQPMFGASELKGFDTQNSIIREVTLSPDQQIGVWSLGASVIIVNSAVKDDMLVETGIYGPEMLATDGVTLAVGGMMQPAILRFDAKTGAPLASLQVSGVIAGGYLVDPPLLWAATAEGGVQFWNKTSGEPVLSFNSFPGDKYFAVTPEGRYDTNLEPDTQVVTWLMPDSPFQTLPSQAFLRSHYTPDLLRKLFACIASDCSGTFKPLPDVSNINRVVPYARIGAITPVPGTAEVDVDVETREGSNSAANGKTRSGVYDLRLFRNEQLVRQWPDLALPPEAGASSALWREKTAIPEAMQGDGKPFVTRFRVPIPSDGKVMLFSAYSFNEDTIKGFTAMQPYTPAQPLPARPHRAVVVAIGVDKTANPDWQLQYAANDADAIVKALHDVPGRVPVPILLTSTAAADNATKANISAVLRQLNGFATHDDRAALQRLGIDPAKLPPLTPDDIVIIAFSGHGETIAGQFYMLPSDAKVLPDGSPDLATLMSSYELTTWARRVEAGDMTFIIDACHSAASVAQTGWKPGPMGDPGLGQLAYDKGIRILAATQSDDVALEDRKFGHGLLTYALVNDGLDKGLAEDRDGDGVLSLDEWLHYAAGRVPALAAEITAGKRQLIGAARGITPGTAALSPPTIQRPALFDFNAGARYRVAIRTGLPQAGATQP